MQFGNIDGRAERRHFPGRPLEAVKRLRRSESVLSQRLLTGAVRLLYPVLDMLASRVAVLVGIGLFSVRANCDDVGDGLVPVPIAERAYPLRLHFSLARLAFRLGVASVGVTARVLHRHCLRFVVRCGCLILGSGCPHDKSLQTLWKRADSLMSTCICLLDKSWQ